MNILLNPKVIRDKELNVTHTDINYLDARYRAADVVSERKAKNHLKQAVVLPYLVSTASPDEVEDDDLIRIITAAADAFVFQIPLSCIEAKRLCAALKAAIAEIEEKKSRRRINDHS